MGQQQVEVDVVQAEGPSDASKPASVVRAPWSSFQSFVVMKTSSRGRPLVRRATPTSASLRYTAAVSTWR